MQWLCASSTAVSAEASVCPCSCHLSVFLFGKLQFWHLFVSLITHHHLEGLSAEVTPSVILRSETWLLSVERLWKLCPYLLLQTHSLSLRVKTRLVWLSGLQTHTGIWKLSCVLASLSTPGRGICTLLLALLMLEAKLFTLMTVTLVVKEMLSVQGTIFSFLKSYPLYSHLSRLSSAQRWFSSPVKM